MEARTAVMEVIEVLDDRLTLCPPRGEIFFYSSCLSSSFWYIFVLLGVRFFQIIFSLLFQSSIPLLSSDGGALECFEARERGPSPSGTRMLGHRRADGGTGGHRRTSSSGSIGSRGGSGELSELGAEIKDIDLARENGTGKQFVNYVLAVRRKEAR